MYAPVTDVAMPAYTNELTAADLVILEFDHWTNPRQPRVSPTTTCWCDSDFVVEWAK